MITVACVIPCFNMSDTLERAILSALEAKMDKVIVVDDCSTDNTSSIIDKYKNSIESWKWGTKSQDWIKSLELVYKETQADFFVGLGADDMIKPGLAQCIKEYSKYPIIFTDYEVVDPERNHIMMVKQDVEHPVYLNPEDMRYRMRNRNIATESGVGSAIRKDIIMGLYNSNFVILGPHTDSIGYATAACFVGCTLVPFVGASYTRSPISYGYDPNISQEIKDQRLINCKYWMTQVGLDKDTISALLMKRCS